MARLRKFAAYRRVERPYTRISKFREKSFIRANPAKVIARYNMGHPTRHFEYNLDLVSKDQLQIRHNALEAARMSCNRLLEKTLGKTAYRLVLRPYPHHILRENPLASGAGADRMSTGMQASFGKPISTAAQIRRGQPIFTLNLNKVDIELGKTALKRAQNKVPCSCAIVITENPKQKA
jgi:large subunit ribosomal protein L10e